VQQTLYAEVAEDAEAAAAARRAVRIEMRLRRQASGEKGLSALVAAASSRSWRRPSTAGTAAA